MKILQGFKSGDDLKRSDIKSATEKGGGFKLFHIRERRRWVKKNSREIGKK